MENSLNLNRQVRIKILDDSLHSAYVNQIVNLRYGDAGFDLRMASVAEHSGSPNVMMYGTGIAVEIPEGYVGLVRDRSSVAVNSDCTVVAGVIDPSYRGEVIVCMRFFGEKPVFEKGERIAQLVVVEAAQPVDFVLTVDHLPATLRGTDGFGSTGRF